MKFVQNFNSVQSAWQATQIQTKLLISYFVKCKFGIKNFNFYLCMVVINYKKMRRLKVACRVLITETTSGLTSTLVF